MRSVANGQINDILNGRTTLWCQLRINDIFGNPSIDSRFAVRELPKILVLLKETEVIQQNKSHP